MARFRDQMRREIQLDQPVRRIVSTVPSQTELLADLGLEDKVVGITAYCNRPTDWLKEKTVIGGTKDLNLEKIRSLQPDLIIGNKEENIKEQIEALSEDIPVWLSDVETVDQALDMIKEIGALTNSPEKAKALIQTITREREAVQKLPFNCRVAFFIWQDPYMLAGKNTFIGALLEELGLENAALTGSGRYPEIQESDLADLDLDLILLTSEPYAFTTSDLHKISRFSRQSKIVDGALFSWYGSRLVKTFLYLARLNRELALVFSEKQTP